MAVIVTNLKKSMTMPNWKLGADRPLTDPIEDEFGYASFASQLAAAIVSSKNPQGLVLSVHGKWGSGKSSLLNFIKYDLGKCPESDRPVLIDFNPWWFEGREQIASQLLEQFSTQLPDKLKHVRYIAKLIGQYSQQIANGAAIYTGYAWIKAPLSFLFGWLPKIKALTEKSGVPEVKKKISKALAKQDKRFVFFIDDIDRLTPDEARDLFRAIKALADFPQVIYVLFFDRDEVSKALNTSLQIDGEGYLEKIIQASFHLPAVDKAQLNQKLFKGLDAVLESRPLPFEFDQSRWISVFYGGLDRYITKLRDVVRILNALSVTYPPLAGEVNPVDFVVLEFLRLFHADVYCAIRDGKDFYCGRSSEVTHKRELEQKYFQHWHQTIPEPSRNSVAMLVGRVFPKISQFLENDFIGDSDVKAWRRELRACAKDCFDVYFQFGLPKGYVSKAEMTNLINQESADVIAELPLIAKGDVLPDGHSKARDILERVADEDSLMPEQATRIIRGIILAGSNLLSKEDEHGGFFSIPNRWRIESVVAGVMQHLDLVARQDLLKSLTEESSNLWIIVGLIDVALDARREPSKAPSAMLDFNEEVLDRLKRIAASRLDDVPLEQLLTFPELDFVVHRWQHWGNPEKIKSKFQPMLEQDDQLLQLIEKFVRTGRRHSGNKTTETYHVSMSALGFVLDILVFEPRIRSLQSRNDLTHRQRMILNYYIKSLPLIREGNNPDDFALNAFGD